MGLLLLIVLILVLFGGVRLDWGPGPNGAVGVVLLILLIVLLTGHLSWY